MATDLWPGSCALLDEATGRELVLDPQGGWFVQELDLGHPVPRDVVDPSPLTDGMQDRTTYHGARAVGMSLTVLDWDVMAAKALLASFHHPRSRPVLRWRAVDGSETQRMKVRPVALDAVINNPMALRASLTWTCPSGVVEGDSANAVLLRFMSGVLRCPFGKTTDLWPIGFTGGVNATATIEVPGTTACWWTATVVGPVTDPAVLVDGQVLFRLLGLVAGGTTISIDGQARTVVDQVGAGWYDKVDWSASLWTPLPPGTHSLTLGGTPQSGASCTLTYRGAWL
jgi:tail protein